MDERKNKADSANGQNWRGLGFNFIEIIKKNIPIKSNKLFNLISLDAIYNLRQKK